MNFTFKKFVVTTWLIFCGLLISGGLAMVLQKLPPNTWLGITPTNEFATEETWYLVNGIAGWLCVFIASVVAIFIFFIRKKNVSKTNWVLQPALVLLLSTLIAALCFEIIIQFLNINT